MRGARWSERHPHVRATCCVALACALHVAAATAPARAEPPDAPRSEADDATYRALIDGALQEFRLHNWPEARALFLRAHAVSPSARTLRGLGMVAYEMRDYPTCIRELKAALDDERQPLTRRHRSEARELIERAEGYVGVYTLDVSPEDHALSVDGETATVDEDGKLRLGLGEHVVRVQAEGHVAETRTLEVRGAEQGHLQFHLSPVPASRAETKAPATPASVEAPTPLQPPAPTPGLRWTWLGAGLTAALGGATAAVWYTGQHALDERVAACRDPDAACDDAERGFTRRQRATTAGWALTGVALATTVTLAVFELRTRDLQVAVGPAQLGLRGHF